MACFPSAVEFLVRDAAVAERSALDIAAPVPRTTDEDEQWNIVDDDDPVEHDGLVSDGAFNENRPLHADESIAGPVVPIEGKGEADDVSRGCNEGICVEGGRSVEEGEGGHTERERTMPPEDRR